MRLAARLRSWIRSILSRSRMEQDMDAELRFHMDRFTEDLIAQGIPREEAIRRARIEFGAVEAHKEECREALGLRVLDELRADIRYAFRMLRQAPVFTAVAILSLALGIGANTAIFTLMETALWKAIPVRSPEQLRLLSWVSGPKEMMDSSWGDWDSSNGRITSTSFSYPVFQALQRDNKFFQSIFAFKPIGRITAVIEGHAELVTADMVSGNFYDGAGVTTIAGRPILPSDDTLNANGTIAVISFAYWQRRFGRDASVIGKKITLNQSPVIIVGVNSPVFTGVQPGENPDVYFPINMQPLILPNQYSDKQSLLADPEYWWVLIMGRLKPGASESTGQAALDVAMMQAVRATLPAKLNRDMPRLHLTTGSRGLDELRGEFSKPLFVLLALVGLVLLIACANLANLLLARATSRQREISVRLALGAGRWRITRQMLTEGTLLALLGGAAGMLLGYWAKNGLPRLISTPWESQQLRAQFDSRVFALSLAVTLLTGVLFSLAPAWRCARSDVNSTLKDGARSTMSIPKLLAAKSLIVFQVGLSLLLLVGAGLFVRTLRNLQSADLGFNPERILLFKIDPPLARYAGALRRELYEDLERRMRSIPGVQSATLSAEALVANGQDTTRVAPRGRKPGPEDRTWINQVGDNFFETMGIPILYGRSLSAQDRENSPPVAVVNQAFVRHFFPSRDPLGLSFGNASKQYQIVGICGDARYNSVRGSIPPTFYCPYKQLPENLTATFELKTAASEASVMGAVRSLVRAVDKDLPVFDVRTQTEQIDATLSRERIFAALTTGFGFLALILSCIGIYGVMAYAVARRTSEIGIRMALGAQARQVSSMILGETVVITAIGIIFGAAAAIALTRFVESLLFGLKPSDPLTITGAVIIMAIVALIAGWWPARKASRLDPMTALRHE